MTCVLSSPTASRLFTPALAARTLRGAAESEVVVQQVKADDWVVTRRGQKGKGRGVTKDELNKWVTVQQEGSLDSDYCHARVAQVALGKWKEIRPQLRAYLERAHKDARDVFQESFCSTLDPVVDFEYPRSMPLDAKKGFFGEALCGVIAETMEIVGRRRWTIPVFLFRLHGEAEEYLWRLITGESVKGKVPGRSGSDFIAMCLDAEGSIQAFLVGEAKCHQRLNITQAREALEKLGREGPLPVSLSQVKRILKDTDAVAHAGTIKAIEKILVQARQRQFQVPRTDLFLLMFADPAVKDYSAPRISEDDKKACYTCGRPLHVVEFHVEDAEEMIKSLYDDLYQTQEGDDAAL